MLCPNSSGITLRATISGLTLRSAIWGAKKLENVPSASDLPMFTLQKRIALRNCGLVDPEDINHYVVAYGGYTGLSKALEMSQVEVIERVERVTS